MYDFAALQTVLAIQQGNCGLQTVLAIQHGDFSTPLRS
jgi:hypothetical protein